MKILETRFASLFSNGKTKTSKTPTLPLLFLLLILCPGCSSITRTPIPHATMLNNLKYWEQTCAMLSPGQVVVPLPPNDGIGIRVFTMRWDTEAGVSELFSRMKRVTHDGLDLGQLNVNETLFVPGKINDLSLMQQNELRTLWEKRIVNALTTKYFDVAPDLLADGLGRGDIVFYYLLVGRHNSAEMGHSDVVKMMCVNSKGQLVAKVQERYGSSYPFGFIDQHGAPREYLF